LGAGAAGPAQPRHADALAAWLHRTHDLVAENPRRVGDRDLAVEHVQVGATDAARLYPHQQLPGSGCGTARSTARSGRPTPSKTIARMATSLSHEGACRACVVRADATS